MIRFRLVHSALEPPPCRAGRRSCRTCSSGLTGRCATKNVVYQITCLICADSGEPPETYIGETKRCIRYRFDEHFRDGVNCTQLTPFGDHMSQHGWRMPYGRCGSCHTNFARATPTFCPFIIIDHTNFDLMVNHIMFWPHQLWKPSSAHVSVTRMSPSLDSPSLYSVNARMPQTGR